MELYSLFRLCVFRFRRIMEGVNIMSVTAICLLGNFRCASDRQGSGGLVRKFRCSLGARRSGRFPPHGSASRDGQRRGRQIYHLAYGNQRGNAYQRVPSPTNRFRLARRVHVRG